MDGAVEKFEKSKIAEHLRIQVVGGRLLVDVGDGRIRGYVIGRDRRGRLRLRIDGHLVVWDPESDAVVWATGRGAT